MQTMGTGLFLWKGCAVKTNNLKLVPSSSGYAELFYEWRHHEATLAHNPISNQSLDEIKDRLINESGSINDIYNKKAIRWFGALDSVAVSNVGLSNINKMMKTAYIGYGVDPNYHGRGIGKETVKQLIDKVFLETDIRKICAYIHVKNQASCKLASSLGFIKEGVLREHFIIQGKPADEAIYGLLRSEWKP